MSKNKKFHFLLVKQLFPSVYSWPQTPQEPSVTSIFHLCLAELFGPRVQVCIPLLVGWQLGMGYPEKIDNQRR
jgi:hypothetical protein